MTGGTVYELRGLRVFECEAEGPAPRDERDAVELISAAWEHRANFIAIAAGRLGEDFFRLKTGVAGAILQKFVTYRLRVAIVGDISRQISESPALRDFVHECNRGPDIWFVPDIEELGARMRG